MVEGSPGWEDVYRYAPQGVEQTDGYWVFAPMLDGEVELFQLGTLLNGDTTTSFATAIVTSTGGAQHLRLPRNSGEKVVRHDDTFRIEIEQRLALSSDAPFEQFRVQTTDAQHGVAADVVIRPFSSHSWPVNGYRYTTTHDSILEGTITIDGTQHAVSTICAFEHAVYKPPAQDGEPVAMPQFWHYEYDAWAAAPKPYGSLVWHMLNRGDEKTGASSFTTSHPTNRDTTFDSYELDYGETKEFEGERLPWEWTVSATKDDQSWSYRVRVRQPLALDPRGKGFLADVLIDCEGTHRGPEGETSIAGRGRTEFLVISYNPVDEDRTF